MSGLGATSASAAAAPPTFDDVFAAPDDPKLNLDYAYAQASEGNLLVAAAALERVLLANPGWDSVRLYYAVVLYRLDDVQAARQQFRQINLDNLTPVQRREAAKYRQLTDAGARETTFRGMVAVGAMHEQDALGALITQLDIPGSRARSGSGTSATVYGRLEWSSWLDDVGDLTAYATGSAYNRSDVSGPDQNFQLLEAQGGLAGRGLMQGWRVGGVVRHTRLFSDPYVLEYGARGQLAMRLSTATTLTPSVEVVRQNFDDAVLKAITPALRGDRDGWRYDAAVGLTHRFGAGSSLGLLAGYERKSASYRPFAYSAPRVEASFSHALGKGAYLNLFGQVRFTSYRAADPVFLMAFRRKDTASYGRLALGAPLSAFTAQGATGDVRENLTVEAAVTYTRRDSRQPVADYDSLGGEVRLMWRFGGGG